MSAASQGVLLVDDDPDIREVMTMVIESAGYRIHTAANGAEALAYLEKAGAPCVILLDLMMPVMPGWQFRAEQQRDARLAAIPTVILTGAGQAAEKAAALGVSEYIEKPVDLDRLLATLRRHC